MKIFGIAVGLAALFAAGSVNAGTLVYDTIPGQSVINGYKPIVANNRGPLGDSFVVSSSEWIQSVTLMVKDNTNDAGSVLVYLVPNNPATGNPTLPSSTGTTLGNTTLLGTILDSTLAGTNVYTPETLSAGLQLDAQEPTGSNLLMEVLRRTATEIVPRRRFSGVSMQILADWVCPQVETFRAMPTPRIPA